MERAYLESNIVTELEKRIEICEQQKKRLTQFIQNLNDKWFEGRISYEDYQKARNASFDGKTISEWLDTYNNYIKDCKRRIKQQKNKFVAKTFLFFFSLAIASILIFSIFYFQPAFIGFAIKGPSENLSQEFNQTNQTRYEEQLEYQEVLNESYSEKQEEVSQKKVSSFQEESPPASEANISEEVEEKLNITEKAPEINITNVSIENITKVDEVDVTITTIQHQAIINEPVRWVKKIKLEKPGTIKVKLPKQAKNIIVNKINPSEERKPANTLITGAAILENGERSSILTSILNSIIDFLKNIFSTITGRATIETTQDEQTEITIEDNSTEYEIEYETPAPQAFEEKTKTGKKITISGPDTLHYEDVLAYTELPLEVPEQKIRLYRTTEGIKEQTEFIPYDKNNNGLIDYIEWTVPHLSNQSYELIIEISKAEHLDENRDFINDIYDEVYQLDNIWSEPIYHNEYVRVTFEKPLDNTRDITIYPRVIEGNPKIEVYEIDSNDKIAEFTNINSNKYNKVFLTNLQESQDTFDLKVIDGKVEFDHIIDPTTLFEDDFETQDDWSKWTVHTNMAFDSVRTQGESSWSIACITAGSTVLCPTESITIDTSGATNFNFSIWFNEDDCEQADVPLLFFDNTSTYDTITSLESTLHGCTDDTWCLYSYYTEDTQYLHANFKIKLDLNPDKNENFWTDTILLSTEAADPAPNWSTNQSSIVETYSPTIQSYFNITWQDNNPPVSTVWFESNYSGSADNYSMNTIATNIYNYSAIFPAGTHYWKSYANDSNSVWNQTDTWIFDITKDSSSCSVIFNESTPQDYGTTFNVSTNCTSAFILYRNETEIDNNSEQNLGAGTWNFTVIRTDDVNYSNIYDEQEFVVDKIAAQTSLIFDKASSQDYGTTINASCSIISGQGNFVLYRNSSDVTAAENNKEIILAAGEHNYECNLSETQNYTAATNQSSFIIDKIVSQVATYVNNSQANATITSGTSIWLNATLTTGDSGATLRLYNDETLINEGITPLSNDTLFSAEGLYNITGIYLESQNYTFSNETWWVNVTPSANDPPTNPTPEINSTDGSNKTLQNLHCFDTILDPNNDTMNVTIRWYKDAALDLTIDYNNNYDNGTFFDETLNSGNTSVNDIWKCEMRLYDGQAYSDWVNSSNLTIVNTAPQIIYVGNESFEAGVTPNEAPDFTTITFNITMKDPDGYADLDDSSIQANVTKTGATTRENLSCVLLGDYDDYYANYSCSISLWYWDAAGYWNITVYGEDLSSASAVNDSTSFKWNQFIGMEISPTLLTWSGISPLSFNETGNDISTLINNTGNVNLTIQVNATHLYGEDDSDYAIYAGNFSAHINLGGDPPAQCDGTTLSNNEFINIVDSVLQPGNLSEGGGAGQEEIYYCIKEVGLISSQIYSTSPSSSWTIGVVALLAAIIIRKKKKKRGIKKDNLVMALGLIIEELKEKYSLNKAETMNFIIKELGEKYKLSKKETLEIIKIKQKETIPITIFSKNLGGLEALCKYMKENLSMSYHEIAEQLARNDRTIWTSYKKAIEKQPEPIKVKETIIFVPISVFKNRKLTVLESIIVYLKEKGIRYNEIAALVNRNQRNIWTIYSRAVSKLTRKSL